MTADFPLKMEHVGKIAHVGNTYVFGLAEHRYGAEENSDANVVYLNLAGPPTSVEAVWAALIERRSVVFEPDVGGRLRFLRHDRVKRNAESETPFIRFQQRIPALAIDHLILVDRRFSEIEYAEVGNAFVFDSPDSYLKVAEHVRQLVNVAVFPEWRARLVEAGTELGLVKSLDGLGQRVLHIGLDRTRWERLISAELKKGSLSWPA